MRLRVLLLTVPLALAACGIKGPPRPPLDELAPERPSLFEAPDAGCCQDRPR